MKNVLRRFFDFLIYSNLYIAIAAVMFTVESQIQLGLKPQLQPYLFLILFATLFEYNLHKFVAVFFYRHALKEEKFKWISDHLRLFYFIVFASVMGFIVAACFAKWTVLFALFPLGALTFLYSFPVYKNGVKLFRLREVPLAKIFIISFVWSATCILLPVIQSGIKIDLFSLFILIIERFLFVFAITVPFDIRDIESDTRSGLKTLPIIIGEKRALRFAGFALILFMMLTTFHYANLHQLFYAGAFLISGLTTFYFIKSVRIQKSKEYHYGILDGTMILQGLLVLIGYLLTTM